MIAVDTNVLARFYVDDPGDPEARKQRPVARRVLAGPSIFVPLTVLLELEWVLRAFYDFDPPDYAAVVNHLLGLSNVVVESRAAVIAAIDAHVAGLDFADALHLYSSGHCGALVTFDDKRFARRAQRLGLRPEVQIAA
ncbi:MAG: type II toxin-antitoxin system VapC family toxin [Lautropia sp.]|nr:type II toxin-antitoxin system VapC family toxin [Lautropia sp.]MBW7926220.1 type II toxin-antitoxin system VapC family toxin [Burkholderiaceae bacterium]MCZ2096685.1 type II toxin-antitoxin system VapC family toxin [Anaerolineae bacterium]MDL1907855.1 type II toxin-antitoxin system VapC family toxin [Betaproteobacteria bacterium PRO1]